MAKWRTDFFGINRTHASDRFSANRRLARKIYSVRFFVTGDVRDREGTFNSCDFIHRPFIVERLVPHAGARTWQWPCDIHLRRLHSVSSRIHSVRNVKSKRLSPQLLPITTTQPTLCSVNNMANLFIRNYSFTKTKL